MKHEAVKIVKNKEIKMTKRYGNFDQIHNKKPKLDDDIEALWGEDLDEDALDDCIKLATQVCEEDKISCTQLNNVTLLPTYNAFKDPNAMFSSTQFECSIRQTTSRNEHLFKKQVVSGNLEQEIQKLRQQYEERGGEVAILRTQLQETKTNNQMEQQRIQNDCKQKLILTEKQMQSIKSELEFKNLEIVNLKQKILDVTKHSNMEVTLNVTQNMTSKIKKDSKTVVEDVKMISGKLQPILDSIYPLKGIIPGSIFNMPKREQHIIETKLTHTCRNAIPYLQNQTFSATIAADKSEININHVYPEILKLMFCTEEELNMDENIVTINKIICTCEQFLDDLKTFLDQITSNLRTEDILESDSNYLKHQDDFSFNSQSFDRDEIGMKPSVLIYFLSELLPYSSYLKKYICHGQSLIVKEKELYEKGFAYLSKKTRNPKQYYFLNMLLSIIKTAGEIRKADFMSNFLCSTIKLLINICKSRNYDYVSDIFCKLTKEIILSRPKIHVICEMTFLLKVASQHSSFIEFLFNKSRSSTTSKKGILYFNEDACRFYIFVMLFDNSVFKLKNECFPINICINMLCFMYNTFKSSHWIHHRDTKECECVPQLYKLEVEIVFRALEKYTEEIKRTKRKRSDWDHFFKNTITVKVLNLMTFNSYELTEKYITVFSQYKEIEKRLQEENDLNELEKLNINEEVIEISSSAFANITF